MVMLSTTEHMFDQPLIMLLFPQSSSIHIPNRLISCSWCSRWKKKKLKNCDPVDVSHLPSDKYGNRCSYYFSMLEPKRTLLPTLFRRGRRQTAVQLPSNCPIPECKKEQVYWFGLERDEIDQLCNPQKPPLHRCRKQQILMAEQCGCLPPAQLCDPTRFHYPEMCIVRESYSAEPLVYRRCEPKPRQAPKPSLPPAVRCIQLACSPQRWLPFPVSEESPKDASEIEYFDVDPYDEFNYVERQQRSKRNAKLTLSDNCAENVERLYA